MLTGDIVTAAFSDRLLSPGGKEPKRVIQYLPKGTHTITAKVNGESATREVIVEAGIEKVYQADLERLQAENVPPFFDYLHDGGRAAGHPKAFSWDDDRGLVVEVEWTEAAKQTITSKELQFFSPEFLLSPDGKPLGLHPTSKSIGGLVSDPAFTSIESIAAARAATKNQTEQKHMDLTKFVELGIITAEQAKDPDKAAALIAEHIRAERSKDNDKDLQAALVTAKREKEAAEAQVKAMKEAQADAFVAEHVKAGRIKPKDDDFKSAIRAQYLSDPKAATAIMERIPATDLEKPVVKAANAGGSTGDQDGDKDLYSQARALVKAGKAKTLTEAVRDLGKDAYAEDRLRLGLGIEAQQLRETVHATLMQAHRNSGN